MGALLSNFRNTFIVSAVLAILLIAVFAGQPNNTSGNMHELMGHAAMRWLHVFFGILWIGLLYYFNFVQIRTMPKIPDELKPAIGKFIAPEALFWFRWAAVGTLVTGILIAWARGYLVSSLTLNAAHGFALDDGTVFIGIGMWLAIIMFLNVWLVIWPNQKIALGLVEAPAEAKPKAARTAMLFSRTNMLLSLPMLVAMTMRQTMWG
ncbi:MAG: urate hydroxylase PuuD [Aquidulcibacter sp.]|jgi:uncharacterized membrane protein|uniref:urate hydroxylase PuuD n=1 Tax=Aquidulcibacter sp. TaxID=2052990 RepID=UPI0022BD4177|nr:urate hydroxylase PuuD [Aquidulcibacter sp.]|eukprot:gene12511-16780_t